MLAPRLVPESPTAQRATSFPIAMAQLVSPGPQPPGAPWLHPQVHGHTWIPTICTSLGCIRVPGAEDNI